MLFGFITTRTYKRMQRLYKYFREFYVPDGLEFRSKLGTVKVNIIKDYTEVNEYFLSYSNYAGTTVFELRANEDITDVSPRLNPNGLTGHAVDLALLELEQYLYDTHGDIEEYLENQSVAQAEAYIAHLDELKILEEGA